MNLLSAVMPGLRDVRTPLAVGAIWIVALYLVGSANWLGIARAHPTIESWGSALSAIPAVYLVGGLAFVAYLVGIATMPVSELIARWTQKLILTGDEPRPRSGRIRRTLDRLRRRTDSIEIREPVMDSVADAYRRAEVPVEASLLYPAEAIIDRLDQTALQLWHSAPTQYQEYDRLKAESAFRVGIALPLATTGVIAGLLVDGWSGFLVGAIAILGALVLVVQAHILDHRRNVLMATVMSQGVVHDSLLESVVGELKRLELPYGKEYASFHHAVALSVAFDKVGAYDLSSDAAAAAGWEAREYAELSWTKDELEAWLSAADRMAGEILGIGSSEDLIMPFRRGLESVRSWWDSSAERRRELLAHHEARAARAS